MPIIKPRGNPRRQRPKPTAPPPETRRGPEPTPPPSPTPESHRHENQASGKPVLLYTGSLILGLALSIGGFLIYTSWKQAVINRDLDAEAALEAERAAIDISNDLDIYEKVSTIASLARREFESNTVALTEAQKDAQSVVFASLEIIVNKNRQDLADYKERLLEILLALNELKMTNAEAFESQLHDRTTEAERRESTESARLLKLLSRILTGVPSGVDARVYLQSAIDDVL